MSVELVTGYYGVDEGGKPKRHVSSSEDGARQAGTVGLGCYALSTGGKLSATMEDANTLVVADGDVVMNGRHVSLPDPTSFTIPTGVQGQKVSNIAVLRYEKAADSVESVTPLVLTGEPSADAPTDPAYSEGSILDGDSPVDMPLYRVVTDGINAGDPVPLFDVLAPMAELRDSVSQLESDSGRQFLYNESSEGYVSYRKLGRVVMLEWEVVQETTGYWQVPTKLPETMRPQYSLYFPSVMTDGSYVIDHTAFAWVGSDGVIGFKVTAEVTGARNCGTACWIV